MTSRFFPNSLKLSSNSVPRRYTHTGGGERQVSGRECDARSRTHGVGAGTSAFPNRAIASLTPEGGGSRDGGGEKGQTTGERGWGGGAGGKRKAWTLTVFPRKFGSLDPQIPRLSQHRFGTGQGPALPDGRHCGGGRGGGGPGAAVLRP